MIRLSVTEDYFWEKLTNICTQPIESAYNIELLDKHLIEVLSIKLERDERKHRCHINMLDHRDQVIISYDTDHSGTWDVEKKLKTIKRKCYSIYKVKLGEMLVRPYLLENPIVNDGYPQFELHPCRTKK